MNFYITLAQQTAVYLACFLMPIFLLNVLTKGFLIKFIQVLSSRGSKILIQVSSHIENYWTVGKIQGTDIIYHDKESRGNKTEPKRLTTPDENVIYKIMGVNATTIDDTKNAFLKKDLTGITGYNPERMQS